MPLVRRGLTAVMMGAALLLGAGGAAAQNTDTYRIHLSVVPLDVAMQANVAGIGDGTATLAGNKLTLNGAFKGLRSPATDAHIHRGPKGIPGPAILDVTVGKATNASFSASLDLTPQQVADLKNEQFYLQLNSERAPEGNLRGWILHN
jgi:hypothetical protein